MKYSYRSYIPFSRRKYLNKRKQKTNWQKKIQEQITFIKKIENPLIRQRREYLKTYPTYSEKLFMQRLIRNGFEFIFQPFIKYSNHKNAIYPDFLILGPKTKIKHSIYVEIDNDNKNLTSQYQVFRTTLLDSPLIRIKNSEVANFDLKHLAT